MWHFQAKRAEGQRQSEDVVLVKPLKCMLVGVFYSPKTSELQGIRNVGLVPEGQIHECS